MKKYSFSVIDLELTEKKEILQIAIIFLNEKFEVIDKINHFCNVNSKISSFISELTGIRKKMVKKEKYFFEISYEIYQKIKNSTLIFHGGQQDYQILKTEFLKNNNKELNNIVIDTLELSKIFFPTLRSYRLEKIAKELDIKNIDLYHRADNDAYITYKLLLKILYKSSCLNISNYSKLIDVLKIYSIDYYNFLKNFRKRFHRKIKINKNDFFKNEGIYFKKIQEIKTKKDKVNKIHVTSILENEYISFFLSDEKNDSLVLGNFSDYIDFNFHKKIVIENKVELFLYMKILVWIMETDTGNLIELNINNEEKEYLKKYKGKNKKNYFYKKNIENSRDKKNIVISYNTFRNIWKSTLFSNSIYVFEDLDILKLEIKKMFSSKISFRDIVKEFDIDNDGLDAKRNILILNKIQKMIDFIYILYNKNNKKVDNEHIKYFISEIKILKQDVNKTKNKLHLTNIFLKKLQDILLFNIDGIVGFEIINSYPCIYIQYSHKTKEKNCLNKLFSKKIIYLNINQKKDKINSIKSCNKFIIFDDNIKKDVSYYKRKKSKHKKYKNYSYFDDFYKLFKYIEKNDNYKFYCYVDKSIFTYSYYLEKLFN